MATAATVPAMRANGALERPCRCREPFRVQLGMQAARLLGRTLHAATGTEGTRVRRVRQTLLSEAHGCAILLCRLQATSLSGEPVGAASISAPVRSGEAAAIHPGRCIATADPELRTGLINRPPLKCTQGVPKPVRWVHLRAKIHCKSLILLVGAPRFELGTPSPPDWCANRAALRSERRGL
jgi:hypothetical protein